jgi:hypothetical protein
MKRAIFTTDVKETPDCIARKKKLLLMSKALLQQTFQQFLRFFVDKYRSSV